MDRPTLRSALQFANQMAANSVQFAQNLVSAGFERDSKVVLQAQGAATTYQLMETELATALAEADHDSTGPVASEPDTPSLELVE